MTQTTINANFESPVARRTRDVMLPVPPDNAGRPAMLSGAEIVPLSSVKNMSFRRHKDQQEVQAAHSGNGTDRNEVGNQ